MFAGRSNIRGPIMRGLRNISRRDADGDDMIAMEAYAFYLYRGKQIMPGLATEQTSPVVVKSGVGYPKKGSGVGYDK